MANRKILRLPSLLTHLVPILEMSLFHKYDPLPVFDWRTDGQEIDTALFHRREWVLELN